MEASTHLKSALRAKDGSDEFTVTAFNEFSQCDGYSEYTIHFYKKDSKRIFGAAIIPYPCAAK